MLFRLKEAQVQRRCLAEIKMTFFNSVTVNWKYVGYIMLYNLIL